MLTYVFDLPAPSAFPALPIKPQGEDADALRRYISAAEEMAESGLLSADDRMRISAANQDSPAVVDAQFSSKEATRGFTTLLRQFDTSSAKERASFLQTHDRLRRLNAACDDEFSAARADLLTRWKSARGHLRAENLRVRVGQKLHREGRMELPPGGKLPGQGRMSPEQLLSAYEYGDLIHWDRRHSSTMATIESDPFERAWTRMLFLDAAAGLTHLYLGFALVVRAATCGAGDSGVLAPAD